jgi:hypothetical protein
VIATGRIGAEFRGRIVEIELSKTATGRIGGTEDGASTVG